MHNHTRDEIENVMNLTDPVSPSFCLAKWYHVTIYLQTGETHSCYHPAPHKIPLSELSTNPSALHNTSLKKLQRKKMLSGEKPSECQYCWNVEDLGPDFISDRKIKTCSIYSKQRMKEVTENPWDFDVNPQYVEISFGNECNFKCGYCHPKASSSYHNEIKTLGRFTNVHNHGDLISGLQLYREEDNPYVTAWWKWWPELSQTLEILRLTGGEPLMHKSTWRLLEDLEKNPKPNLNFYLNSNLGGPTRWVEKLSVHIKNLLSEKKIKSFMLFTSLDSWGKKAEYIRTGLNIELWEKNLETYICGTQTPITIMVTFNILSVTSFQSFLEKVLEWRHKYHDLIPECGLNRKIAFDTPYLKEPLQYDMNLLPKQEFLPYMDAALSFMKNHLDDNDVRKFSTLEYEKFRRVVEYMRSTQYPTRMITQGRRDFYHWFQQYDSRRNVDFAATFPEYTGFMGLCQNS